MSGRPTVRPVTMARLIELTHACQGESHTTKELEDQLDVTHRRVREIILEAIRIGFVSKQDSKTDTGDPLYTTTEVGGRFLTTVQKENWSKTSKIIESQSYHYRAFLSALEDVAPAELNTILDKVQQLEESTERSYNRTSIEVLSDWAERLGRTQRNAFTGSYYPVTSTDIPSGFVDILLSTFDSLEETAYVALRQRYISIPELREHLCERIGCPRPLFDEALVALVQQNVGKAELSGAPIDTGAKDAQFGIRSMAIDKNESLVSTDQSTERIMRGVEQFGKQYYYLAIHDRELRYHYNDD